MKVLCAWCNTVIRGRGSALSHGICRRCFQDLFQAQFEFMATVPSLPTSPVQLHGRRAHPAARLSRLNPSAEPFLFSFPAA